MPALALTPTPLEEPLLQLVDATEVVDRLKIMKEQESTTYHVFDYLAKHSELLKRVNKPIDEDCRVKMCEWCYQVRYCDCCLYYSSCNCQAHQNSNTAQMLSLLDCSRLWIFASFDVKPCLLVCPTWTVTYVRDRAARPWPIARSIN